MALSQSQLKAFHAVASQGGFTRAAEQLCLSQPAVSDQVRKLEEQFGVLLFHRGKRAVRLSELGERLFGVTQRLFAVEAEAAELLSSASALQSGSLTLAVDSPVHLLPYLATFRQRYPGIRLRLVTGNSDEALARLFSYKADLAVLGRPLADERLYCLPLGSAPLVAFVHHEHPWAGRESIGLAELDGVPMVLREQGSMTRQMFEAALRQIGVEPCPALEVEGREAVLEMVLAGLGVGVVSAAEFSANPLLRALPIRDCPVRMSETLVCLREQASRRLVEAFLALLRE